MKVTYHMMKEIKSRYVYTLALYDPRKISKQRDKASQVNGHIALFTTSHELIAQQQENTMIKL